MIKVLADKYLLELEAMLPGEAAVERFDPDGGLPRGTLDYDAFLTRTVIPVDEGTVDAFTGRLSFVGTGSSGTDHVDRPLLEKRGIAFADAAGCNARSVAEYVLAGLVWWTEERAIPAERMNELEVGIVGAGHTGGALRRRLRRCGVERLRLYDPPRARREADFTSCTREEALQCDVLSLHVPLTGDGPFPTRHWLDADALEQCRAGLIVNASRGGVADEQALLAWSGGSAGRRFIIDTWEGEPAFRDDTARAAFLATPHIAGYSRQAKREASRMIAVALCRHFGLPSPDRTETDGSRPAGLTGTPSSPGDVLRRLHPARGYEERLLALTGLPDPQKSGAFNRLRSTFPLRDEFSALALDSGLHRSYPLLRRIGFGERAG